MIFTQQELIQALRLAVNVDNQEQGVDGRLNMTDEELMLFIKLGLSEVYPSCETLDDLPIGADYPIILVSKKELYLKLAVTYAPWYNIAAEGGNTLSRSQRFEHFMKLAENAQDEYENWQKTDGDIDPETGISGVRTYDVRLNKNHYTERNYILAKAPVVRIKIAEVTNDSVSFSWSSAGNDHFGKYLVYISESPVVDMYLDGSRAENKIAEGATLVLSTMDFHNNYKRVSGLKADTSYYLAVFSIERNQRFGYKEKEFRTAEEFVAEETSVDSIGG